MVELSLIFLLIVLCLGIGIGILQLNKNSTTQTSSQTPLAGTNFTPSQMYLDHAGGVGIALNESTKTICIISSSTLPPKLLHFTSLLAVFLVKNQTVLLQTLRTQPKDFSALALEAKKNIQALFEIQNQPMPQEPTQKIDLCLVLKEKEEEDSQTHIVNFLDMDTKEDGILFSKALVTAKHWHHLLSDLVQQASGLSTVEACPPSSRHDQCAGSSIAHELEKLNELLNKDVITQKDFEEAKDKILSRV